MGQAYLINKNICNDFVLKNLYTRKISVMNYKKNQNGNSYHDQNRSQFKFLPFLRTHNDSGNNNINDDGFL